MMEFRNQSHREWFGHEKIGEDNRRARVRAAFESVAPRYDVMNDLMSLGLHRVWKHRLLAALRPSVDQILLDVAGGTGDISMGYVRRASPRGRRGQESQEDQKRGKARAILVDPNQDMLAQARQRIIDNGCYPQVRLVQGDGEQLPIASRSVDVYAISFGLRNITDIPVALTEARRVLKPGGRFFCLEFSKPQARSLRRAYRLYCRILMPALGAAVARDKDSYRYLADSIDRFMTPQALVNRLIDAGFNAVQYRPFHGGIVAMHWALAP